VVTKTRQTKKSRVAVGKLKLNKETVKNLTKGKAKQVKGAGLSGACVAELKYQPRTGLGTADATIGKNSLNYGACSGFPNCVT
jgi:hypothetical protein